MFFLRSINEKKINLIENIWQTKVFILIKKFKISAILPTKKLPKKIFS